MAPRVAVPITLDPAACRGWDRAADTVLLGGETMGTGWRVLFARPASVEAAPIGAAIQSMLDTLVAEMSHWDPRSLLSRFNNSVGAGWTTLPPDFATVMAAGLEVARRSNGAFDPAIGALVDVWGQGATPATRLPNAAVIDEARARGGWRKLAFEPATCQLRQPGGLRLDLSGIAKGYAVDRTADLLAARGMHHALVEIGGELVGRGLRPDGDPWWVEVETPGGCAAPLRVALHQLAIATSGDYVRGQHTLDPRTGHPIAHAMSASVIHASAMFADAWATALSVAEPETASELARREALAARLLWRTSTGVKEWISPTLAAMIDKAPA